MGAKDTNLPILNFKKLHKKQVKTETIILKMKISKIVNFTSCPPSWAGNMALRTAIF